MAASPYFQGTAMTRNSGLSGVRLARQDTGLGGGIADALGQLVTRAMYDPERDPDAQKAKLYGEQAKALASTREGGAALSQLVATLSSPADVKEKATTLASTVARFGLDPEAAAKTVRLAGAMAGYDQQSMDMLFQASGGRPDQTRSAYDAGLASHERSAATTAGIAAAASRYHTDKVVGEQKYQFDNSGVNVIDDTGRPTIVPNSASYGKQPVLSHTQAQGAMLQTLAPTMAPENKLVAAGAYPNEGMVKGALLSSMVADLTRPERLKAVGAEPSVRPTHNYRATAPDGSPIAGRTVDGQTDITTGAPLPQNAQTFNGSVTVQDPGALTTSNKTAAQKTVMSTDNALSLIDKLQGIAKDHPEYFGIPGAVNRAMVGVTGQAKGVGALLGVDVAGAVDDIRKRAELNGTRGLVPGFDPKEATLSSYGEFLPYMLADIIGGQRGSGLNKQDIETFRRAGGDVSSLFTTSEQYIAKLDAMKAELLSRNARSKAALGGGLSTGAAPPPVGNPSPFKIPPAAPASAAPAPPAAPLPPPADLLQQARDAIARGAPRDKVIEQLRLDGVDPGGL